jgi:hypothetical protein
MEIRIFRTSVTACPAIAGKLSDFIDEHKLEPLQNKIGILLVKME